ncbi:hypothetical protein BC828DRAFT_389559 [Blastocladiella britannica]|nr:hypothetical protein BC828DRAFT_389559 [Blastocladiella britannica]
MDQSILPTTLEAAFTTIAALQHDQSRAIAALKLAEDHLERLAADRDAALDAHAQLQQSHSDSLRALQHALATKSAEMDDLARRVPSQREMAAVRAMLEAEVRNGVKRELETLQVDAKAALAVVERVRNENTKLAEDLAETKSRLETEQQHERTEFMIKIRNLEHQIEKSEAAANATLSRDETVRKLQATIEELQLKNSRLLVENDDLRAAKQSMTTTLTGTTTAAARSDLDHKVALESLRVDRDLLAAKLNRAHDEQQSMIRHRHELSQQLTASQLEVAAAKRASEDRGRAAKEAQWKFDTERTKERAEWERERRELLQRIDELACQVSSYSEGQHERRTDKSNTSVALDLADTCSTLESRLRDAYAQIQELQSEQSADSASREAQAHKYLSERASLLRRTESITAALEEARHELASATRSRQDLDAALARSRESEEHLKAALARATEQRDALSDELATVKEESGWLRYLPLFSFDFDCWLSSKFKQDTL